MENKCTLRRTINGIDYKAERIISMTQMPLSDDFNKQLGKAVELKYENRREIEINRLLGYIRPFTFLISALVIYIVSFTIF